MLDILDTLTDTSDLLTVPTPGRCGPDRRTRRVDAYGAIPTPTLFLSGSNSPAHLGERTRAVAAVMPHATITTMPGQGHGAHTQDPALVARLIAEHARTVGLGGTGS